jgi:hypothetical protein
VGQIQDPESSRSTGRTDHRKLARTKRFGHGIRGRFDMEAPRRSARRDSWRKLDDVRRCGRHDLGPPRSARSTTRQAPRSERAPSPVSRWNGLDGTTRLDLPHRDRSTRRGLSHTRERVAQSPPLRETLIDRLSSANGEACLRDSANHYLSTVIDRHRASIDIAIRRPRLTLSRRARRAGRSGWAHPARKYSAHIDTFLTITRKTVRVASASGANFLYDV